MLKVLEVVLKVVEDVLYMLEVVNGVRHILSVPGVMLRMLFCVLLCMLSILEAMEGELRFLEVLE